MWRSFFYSIGIGLFVLGLQALVVDHVVVPKNTKIQKLIRKIMSDDKPVATNNVAIPQPAVDVYGTQNRNGWTAQQASAPLRNGARQPNNAYSYDSGSRFGPSRFGPSRFSGPANGTGYGGPRISSPQARTSNFNVQPPQGNSAQLAGYRSPGSNGFVAKKPIAMQKFVIREWMPWSLLASGAIIFLYTHTIDRRRFQD